MICGTISGGLINFSSDFSPLIGRVLAGVRECTRLSRLDVFQSLFKDQFLIGYKIRNSVFVKPSEKHKMK